MPAFVLWLLLFPLPSAHGAALLTSQLFGGGGEDSLRDLAIAPDGTLYAVGLRYDEAGGEYDAWVLHLDAAGNLLCEATIGGGDGGDGDDAALAVAVDGGGAVYVAGTTSSPALPVRGYTETTPIQGEMGADPETLEPSVSDAFLARLDDQCKIRFLTYLGGSGRDSARDLALFEGVGGTRIYVLGTSDSPGLGSETAYQADPGGAADLYVARFNDQGQRLYFTYLGGAGEDWGAALAVDPASGDVAVTGFTASAGLATDGVWDGAYQAGQCAFNRRDPLAATHACYDILLARLDANLRDARFVTYLGGHEDDYPAALAFDAQGDLVLAGGTLSPPAVVDDPALTPDPFPLTTLPPDGAGDSESLDAFVLALAGDGGALRWSVMPRGSENEFYNGLALGPGGEIYLAGHGWSEDLPWAEPLQTQVAGGEGRVSVLDGNGGIRFDTLLGGVDSDFLYAVRGDGGGRLWLAGGSRSPDPGGITASAAAGQSDAWLASIDLGDTRQVDLALGGGFDGREAQTGQRATLRLEVAQNGSETAPAVRLFLRLPAGLRLEAAPEGCRTGPDRLLCPLGDLPPGEVRSVAFTFVPERGGAMPIQAGVGAALGEARPEDDRLQDALQVQAPPVSAAWGPLALVLLALLRRLRS